MKNAPHPTSMLAKLWTAGARVTAMLNALQPAAQLLARWYVGMVFFRSGLTKLNDWETTLLLFGDDYQVPLLSPTVAAYLGTGGELVLPVLLILGLAGRFAAAGLFVVNVVAVLSLAEIPDAAYQLHVFWGSLLAGLLLWGPGRWSVDHVVAPWLRRLFGADESANRYTAAASPTQG